MSIEKMKQALEEMRRLARVANVDHVENAGIVALEQAIEQAEQQDRQIDQLIQDRDHREEIIDKLCDAVLGPDRYEWSSQYFFDDAVREVEERMAAIEQAEQPQPADARACEVYTQGEWVLYPLTIAAEAKERGWPIRYLVPAIAQPEQAQPVARWHLDGEAALFLAETITANDEPTEIVLRVGYVQDDDGIVRHGLLVEEADYPEEGASLLVECDPYTASPPRQSLTETQAHDMGAKGGEPTEAERLLFEAWMRGHCWKVRGTWNGEQYSSPTEINGDVDLHTMHTRQLWAAWRDRAALEAAHGKEGGTT